jgi:hypothetical protein
VAREQQSMHLVSVGSILLLFVVAANNGRYVCHGTNGSGRSLSRRRSGGNLWNCRVEIIRPTGLS